MEFARGPKARTEGYSISGSHAKSVALNCGGTFRGGNRFSVSGPVRAGSWAATRPTITATNSVKTGQTGKYLTFIVATELGLIEELQLRRTAATERISIQLRKSTGI